MPRTRVRGASPAAWLSEARALLALALPLVAGNLAWMAIASTDLLLLGRLGPGAVAAGALAINVYYVFLVFGMGLVTAASPLIASERGRRRHSVRDIRRTVRQTIWAAVAICLPAWIVLWHGRAVLVFLHHDPALAEGAEQLLHGVEWALLPNLVFLTLRNFITSLERPGWAVVVLALGVPFNLLAGWTLIFGHFGAPALGLFGAGVASSLSMLFMAGGMALVVSADHRFRRFRLFGRFWQPDRARFADVWRIGLPIAVTQMLESTVFNAALFLMGLIDRASLAAHAIAIQVAAISFMVPMGLGQAATVRVGVAHGRGDRQAIGRAGWAALALGIGYAALSALVLTLLPRALIGLFIDVRDPANATVVALGTGFLGVAALFQLFDCTQVIAAGALRGLQDTRVPMLCAAFGYWVVGIGVATLLGFPIGLRGVGVWLGLASGLATVSVLLGWRWIARGRIGLVPELFHGR